MAAGAALAQMGDHATHSEKVRGTFDELDARRAQAVAWDEWLATFQRLNIDLPPSTVRTLFERADTNHDGIIDYSEFQRFAEVYPTILDSLYYRSRDYWVDRHQRDGLEAARRAAAALRDQYEALHVGRIDAQRAAEEQERRVGQQQQLVADSQGREAEAAAAHAAARDAVAQCHEDLQRAHGDVTSSRDVERSRAHQLADLQRTVEAHSQRVQATDAEVALAEARVREVELLLAEARRDLDHRAAAGQAARGDLQAAAHQERAAQAAAAESAQTVQQCIARLAQMEKELAARADREREAALRQRQAQVETARQLQRRDDDAGLLARLREAEQQAAAQTDHAAAVLREREAHAAALEQQCIDFNAQRRGVENEERGLLEQEVRLREQRDMLEHEEARLRGDVTCFAGKTGRSSSPGAFLSPGHAGSLLPRHPMQPQLPAPPPASHYAGLGQSLSQARQPYPTDPRGWG
eukprot:TRINITY_DN732_c0_g1_i1.p1 TRINITY_DN732_c0_g1~~TRINITY_DN732_c0_g1_i1.p1  ORF type:complete len:500 (+),score=190.34 TRINITY_DN732_c0_g1_i1:99-1502(+)